MHDSNARTNSAPVSGSFSTLRPRTRRLISGLDDGEELASGLSSTINSRISSPIRSSLISRDPSPIPVERLSRPGSSNRNGAAGDRLGGRGTRVRGLAGRAESPSSLAGLWGNSWSALQGIATDLLGSEVAGPSHRTMPRTEKPLVNLECGKSPSLAVPAQWGPTAAPNVQDVATGSRSEMENAVRARKRRDLLLQQESSNTDMLGKFKRRTSDEDQTASISAPPGDHDDRDALVYLHHVQKADTLAGITIRYNCSVNTVRRANRMWSNDTVHSREAIVLPVDACGVKGKPVSGSEAIDLLTGDVRALASGQAEDETTPSRHGKHAYPSLHQRRPSVTTASNADTEPPWHHDSWVLLPNATKPTEIVRLSRRSLGYFPPARRKSNTHTELTTPSTSLDLTCSPAPVLAAHRALSPARQDPPQRPPRTRKLSNATTGYFPSYLTGPGGVGSMSSDIRSPGPGQDSLNKMFAKHLPDVAPPKNQQSLYAPELPLYTDAGTPISSSGTVTPNVAHALNLEHVGGAIEHWMRKVASRAKSSVDPATERTRAAWASVGVSGSGAGDVGDLIEMTDEFEIGGDDEESEDDGRGRQNSKPIGGTFASGWAQDSGRSSARCREGSHANKAMKDD